MLTTQLTTSAQQQQAISIFTNAATAGASMHGNLKLAHQNPQAAVKNNDTAGIDAAATARPAIHRSADRQRIQSSCGLLSDPDS
jgi:hypothetical protein